MILRLGALGPLVRSLKMEAARRQMAHVKFGPLRSQFNSHIPLNGAFIKSTKTINTRALTQKFVDFDREMSRVIIDRNQI